MIQLRASIESTRSRSQLYTAQGLGDRFHLVSIAHQLSTSLNDFVTLHLAENHTNNRKIDSFFEILDLFANKKVKIHFHRAFFLTDHEFSTYLQDNGIDSQSIIYRDFPGWREPKTGIDVSSFLYNRSLIKVEPDHKVNLPLRYVAAQWDSTGKSRRLRKSIQEAIQNHYMKMGYKIILVGGESKDVSLKNCLRCATYVIQNSDIYVGVDSGFMHVALQTLPVKSIHIYSSSGMFWSHHLWRAIDMGVVLNKYLINVGSVKMKCLRIRYTSTILLKFIHEVKFLMRIE